jgi:hypothetical protein
MGSPQCIFGRLFPMLERNRAAWCCLAVPEKFFRPSTTSSIFAFPTSLMTSIFLLDDLVTALSTLVRLESLAVGFHSPASFPPSSATPPPAQCFTLPLLTFLDFHGTSEHTEEFVARIGLPCHLSAKSPSSFLTNFFFELSWFCQFIPRLIAPELLTSVFLTCILSVVSQCRLVNERISLNTSCILKTSCTRLDWEFWQLSFVTQSLTQLSPPLFSVRLLSVEKDGELRVRKEDVDLTQWLEIFQPFTHVSHWQVHVWETQLVPCIVQTLVAEDMAPDIFPELISLSQRGYRSSPYVAKAAVHFVTTRCAAAGSRTALYPCLID